jgi:plastocyanin
MKAFMAGNNNLEVTNGLAFKYVPAVGKVAKIDLNKDAKPLLVKPGELTRWYVVNAGPNQFVAFHFIAGQGDLRNGYVGNRYGFQERAEETWTIPPGSASVIESTFPEEGPYVGVTHKMNDVVKGGAFVVVGRNNSTMDDIPPEAMVPKPGSGVAAAATTSTSNQTSVNVTNPVPNPAANVTGNQTTTGNLTAGGEVTNSTSSGGATTSPTASTSGGGSATAVSIVNGASTKTNDAFSPNPISAKVGDNVTWTNNDIQPHTVVSGTGPNDPKKGEAFNSSPNLNPLINAGATFSHKFTQAGTFQYFCEIHPMMTGTVNVS